MPNPRSSLKRDAAQLHVWLNQIYDNEDPRLDPAHAFRISAVSEAVRNAADAIEADPRCLRRWFCEDLAVLCARLSQDLRAIEAGPLTVHMAEVFDDVSAAFVELGDGLFGSVPVSASTAVDAAAEGTVGCVSRKAMLAWAGRVNEACARIEETVLANPAFTAHSLTPAIRDASAARVMLQTAAAGFADCKLVDLARVERQVREAGMVCVQASSHLSHVDSLSAVRVRGGVEAMRAFDAMQTVSVEGADLARSARSASTDPLQVIWRLASRGRALFRDEDVADLVDRKGPLDAIARAFGRSCEDMSLARGLGRVAYANRAEWLG